MDIESLDIRLLTVFETVMRERSLTRAAARLDLSQPAISQALARLRRYLEDPLFVRAGTSLAPTPRALEMADAVRTIVSTARQQLGQREPFDRRTARRVFGIYGTDAGSMVFMPTLVGALGRSAPNCRLRVVPIDERFPEGLASGEVDLAFGSFTRLGAGFYQQKLYEDSYVCLAREGHPLSSPAGMTQAAYLAASHVITTGVPGHGHRTVERMLLELLPADRVVAEVHSFLAAAATVASSDCIATLPGRSGRLVAKAFALRVLAPPVALPRFEARQYWHERYHRDPANEWLRAQCAALFGPRRK